MHSHQIAKVSSSSSELNPKLGPPVPLVQYSRRFCRLLDRILGCSASWFFCRRGVLSVMYQFSKMRQAEFDANGYVVVPRFLSATWVARVRERFEPLFAGRLRNWPLSRRVELEKRTGRAGSDAPDLQWVEV